MINLYNNNNLYLITIESCNYSDYDSMKNIINKIIKNTLCNLEYITIYIDIYKLENYSLFYLYKLILYNNKFNISEIKFIKSIELYINTKNKLINNTFISILKNMCPIIINLNYIKNKKKWHKIFKDY